MLSIFEGRMRLRKAAFSTFMLASALYILLPTADEIFIHPALGLFFSYVFHIPLSLGIVLSILLYRAAGFGCLITALVIGGKPIYGKLKASITKTVLKFKNSK
jgi:hypothetical protein